MATFTLPNREAMQRWGETLGKRLRSGDVVALVGDLGAGKTTLTQAMARGIGITEPVTSPTFTLIHEYPGPVPLFHFDTYRLEQPEELTALGFDEYMEQGGVVVVEWADRVAPLLPAERLTVQLEMISEGEEAFAEDGPRRVSVTGTSSRYALLAEEASAWAVSAAPEADGKAEP